MALKLGQVSTRFRADPPTHTCGPPPTQRASGTVAPGAWLNFAHRESGPRAIPKQVTGPDSSPGPPGSRSLPPPLGLSRARTVLLPGSIAPRGDA